MEREIDTDTSPLCAEVPGAEAYCVVAASGAISIPVTLRAFGRRPLVLAADSIQADALIDVGSRRGEDHELGAGAQPATCAAAAQLSGPGAGGAGGSFGSTGGRGGPSAQGDAGGAPSTAIPIDDLRGGCSGQLGDGGAAAGLAGGAVHLFAHTQIVINGINASGSGGAGGAGMGGGGAGGGTGGMISLDAPSVTGQGLISANGGGGGEGGGQNMPGRRGADPDRVTAAVGGSGAAPEGGEGGDGGANTAAGDGRAGTLGAGPGGSGGGGGGGGGSAGVIRAPATATLGSQVSPAVTQ